MAKDGRLVILAVLGGYKIKKINLIPLLQKRLSVLGSTLRSRSLEYKIRLTREFSTYTLDLFQQEVLKPVIDSVYDWKDLEHLDIGFLLRDILLPPCYLWSAFEPNNKQESIHGPA